VPKINQIRSFSGKFVLQLAKNPDPGQLLFGPNTAYLNGKSEAILNAPQLWTHVVQAYTRSEFDAVDELLNTVESPRVWMRYGVTDGTTSSFTEWEPQIIVSAKTQPSPTPSMPHGHSVVLVTSDLLYQMGKDQRVASRKGKVNDIMSSIALECGFEKLAVEPTQGDFALIQSFETDYDFVTSRLLPIAINKEGASQYMLYARGAFCHFHTVNYQVSGIFAFDYGAPSNTLTNVFLANKTNTNENTSAAGIRLVAFDPLTGKTTVWETKASSELSFANTAPSVKGTVYARKHVGQNQLTALYNESQKDYVGTFDMMHEVGFLVDNYPFIGVGDIVDAQFVNGSGDPWSGFYFVSFAKHEITNNRVTSLYRLSRGEFVSSNPNVEGKQLNTSEVSSSQLTAETSGNFPSLNGGTVVSVNSPESLLIPPPAS
jgi:hypothetical protein